MLATFDLFVFFYLFINTNDLLLCMVIGINSKFTVIYLQLLLSLGLWADMSRTLFYEREEKHYSWKKYNHLFLQ